LEMKGDEGLFECNRNWDRGWEIGLGGVCQVERWPLGQTALD
jgi:hypothetical protein